MGRLSPIRKAFIKDQIIALGLAAGLAVAVTIGILVPSTVEQTAASLILPDWLEKVFSFSYAIAGWAAALGIYRHRANIEAAGWALLASALTVQFVTLIYLQPSLWVQTSFLIALALAAGARAWFLSRETNG